ncbi:MAG: DUF6443 domain-containing protein [Bacteroidota bacterium]
MPLTQTEVEALSNTSEDDNAKIETISYVDGLGRLKQSVAIRAGGAGQDIISPMEYDGYGRQAKSYLPYPKLNNQGTIVANPFAEIDPFYLTKFPADSENGTINPYSESRFEVSPLNRVMEQGAPGMDWKVNHGDDYDHTIKYDYRSNLTGIYYFSVEFLTGETDDPSLRYNGEYANGELYVTETRNENWQPGDDRAGKIYEYTNSLGQVILKRSIDGEPGKGLGPTGPMVYHDTYYVYDHYGNLTYVLSPEASDKIIVGQAILPGVVNDFGYMYKYDHRNRLVEKKIPGKGWEYIVYNKLDQPVLTQDANLRETDEWLFTKYDELGRVILTGKWRNYKDRGDMQTYIDGFASPYESRSATPVSIDGVDIYYTNSMAPWDSLYEIQTINYYDDYNVDHSPTILPTTVLDQTVSLNTKGLPTVSKVKVLGESNWITTLTAYDQNGRAIYVDSFNASIATREIEKSKLDFVGKTVEIESQHLRSGFPNIVARDYFTYDSQGRIITHKQKLDNQKVQLIARNVYDDLGQLSVKNVGGIAILEGWKDLEDVTVDHNGTVTKASGTWGNGDWAAKAHSIGVIPGGYDGGMDILVNQNNKRVRVGLVLSGNNQALNSYFDYGLHLHEDGTVRSLENTSGYGVVLNGVTYAQGDLFRIERIGNMVRIKKGNTIIKTFYNIGSTNVDKDLRAKVAFNGPAGSVYNLYMFGPELDNPLQSINYDYNIRGWLTAINDVEGTTGGIGIGSGSGQNNDLFNFKINYNQVDANTGATPLYNGNIAQTLWKTKNDDQQIRGYDYSYDRINRIVGASGIKGNALNSLLGYNFHDVSDISYDLNGNILSLDRTGTDGNYSPPA